MLGAICWLLVGLSLLWVFIMVFKPRATDADMIPAQVMYGLSIAAAASSLLLGVHAWRRSPNPGKRPPNELLLPAAGLVVPALFILWVHSATAGEAAQRERSRRTQANPELEKATPIALAGDALERAWRQEREATDQQYQDKVVAVSDSFRSAIKPDKVDAKFLSAAEHPSLRFYPAPALLSEWEKDSSGGEKPFTLRCLYGGSVEEKGTFGGVHRYLALLSCVR